MKTLSFISIGRRPNGVHPTRQTNNPGGQYGPLDSQWVGTKFVGKLQKKSESTLCRQPAIPSSSGPLRDQLDLERPSILQEAVKNAGRLGLFTARRITFNWQTVRK
jgi:hypothetical protein